MNSHTAVHPTFPYTDIRDVYIRIRFPNFVHIVPFLLYCLLAKDGTFTGAISVADLRSNSVWTCFWTV